MINRRHLVQALAALGGGLGLTPPASARPAPAADFAAAVARQPLLTPFKGVTDATGDRFTGRLATRGRWPAALAGRFYRNGPALYERGGERYHHWFDGDGMVQQFTLAGGQISHRGRLVRTTKLEAEARAGRFLMNAFGTSVPGGPPGTGPDSFNTANTNALEHAGRVLAMWEGGSAYGLDPKDLSTQGAVVWRKDLAQVPFSAHPKLDPQGHLWNIGTSGAHIVAWHIDPQGALVGAQVGELPHAGGLVHDLAVTERYLVVPLPPLPPMQQNFNAPASDGPRRFALQAGQPLRVLVMDKADIGKRRVFELPPQAVFHVGNAHETADGQLVLSYVGAPDAWFLDVGAVALMKGQAATGSSSSTHIARLDMATGRASTQSLGDTVEFPRIDPRCIGLPARWLLSAASWTPEHREGSALLHGLQLRDTQGGGVRRFDYGAHVAVEEHVMVPKPSQRGELDAWLLGTTFDAKTQATVLNLLDAAHIEDGPIAQATLPYVLPLGFHGNFTAA
jgi:all-trans-8'-apo-beta-carotenal 15,15'-oxygenase